MSDRFDLLIIGGGPAGLAAATALSGRGLKIAVLDEQPRPGGQIARQPPAAYRVQGWLKGRAYAGIKATLAAFEAATDIEWHGGRSTIGLEREAGGFRVVTAGSSGVGVYRADRVLLATGCYDLPMARPGWTIPGAIAAGGVQTLLKSQQILPGEPLVLAGTHPLMLLIAEQVTAAGGTVSTVAFDQTLAAMIGPMLRNGGTVLRNLPSFAGVLAGLLRLRRRGVAVHFGLPLAAIEGEDRVTAARFARPGGPTERAYCAAIGLCYGFVPQSDLSRLVGADVGWATPAGGWATRHDGAMRASLPGLYIAGETAGVGGAASALTEGQLAALSILHDLGLDAGSVARLSRLRRRQRQQRAFASLLAAIGDPTEASLRPLAPDTLVCRCEDVASGAIDDAVARGGSANAIKLECRIGMGLCQGRSCEQALLRRIARRDGATLDVQNGFAIRFPVRPVRIGDLATARAVAPGATNFAMRGD